MTFPLFVKRHILELPPEVQLALQGTKWVDYVDIYGYNPAVGTTEEFIWAESGTLYTYPTVAQNMTISSANANDTSAGTGLRTALVEFLDANYEYQSYTATLNGQTGVAISPAVMRILKVTGLTAGSGGKNAGIVYTGYGDITTGKPATVQSHMIAGSNSTLLAKFTVPAGKTAYLLNLDGRSNGKGELRLYTRPFGGIFSLRRNVVITDTTDHDFAIAKKYEAKTDIEIRGLADLATDKMSASMELILI